MWSTGPESFLEFVTAEPTAARGFLRPSPARSASTSPSPTTSSSSTSRAGSRSGSSRWDPDPGRPADGRTCRPRRHPRRPREPLRRQPGERDPDPLRVAAPRPDRARRAPIRAEEGRRRWRGSPTSSRARSSGAVSPGTSRTTIVRASTSTSSRRSRERRDERLAPLVVDGDPEVVRRVGDHFPHDAEDATGRGPHLAPLELVRPPLPFRRAREARTRARRGRRRGAPRRRSGRRRRRTSRAAGRPCRRTRPTVSAAPSSRTRWRRRPIDRGCRNGSGRRPRRGGRGPRSRLPTTTVGSSTSVFDVDHGADALALAAARTTVRIALAVRPPRPITLPMSSGATRTR